MSTSISTTVRTLRRSVRLPVALGLAATAAALLLTACGDDDNPVGFEHVHTTEVIALARTAVTLPTGQQTTLVAQARCSDGVATGAVINWSSSVTSVATITPAGLLTAISFGTATITATADGISATVAVTVTPLGTVIGPAGGTVLSADGMVELVIPPGALTTDTDIQIVKVDDAGFRNDVLYVKESAYELLPRGLTANKPMHLRIRYLPANVPANADPAMLRIRERDVAQNQWMARDHDGIVGQVVAANITQFGIFAILSTGSIPGPGLTVTIVPSPLGLEVGQSMLLTAVVRNAAGDRLNLPVTWSTDDPAIAAIDQAGFVTGMVEGTSTIRASVAGGEGDAAVNIYDPPAYVVIDPPMRYPVAVGTFLQLSATVYDADGHPIPVPVTWSSNRESIATVDPVGLVHALAVGAAEIRATAHGANGDVVEVIVLVTTTTP